MLPVAAHADDVELLPDLSLRMSAARYAPSEQDFRWVAWLGGDAGLLRAGKVTLFGSANVETIIGSERRAFDANQANYHLEIGLRRSFAKRDLELFFNHVSRHRQDRAKPEAVDWNTLGLRLSGRLTDTLRFELSGGHTTLASLVGYGYEGVAGLEADLVTRPRFTFYAGGRARGVTAEASAELPRNGFVDWYVETGFRLPRGARSLTTFLAYERRNDVFVTAPGERKRALLGIRFALAERTRS